MMRVNVFFYTMGLPIATHWPPTGGAVVTGPAILNNITNSIQYSLKSSVWFVSFILWEISRN